MLGELFFGKVQWVDTVRKSTTVTVTTSEKPEIKLNQLKLVDYMYNYVLCLLLLL